MKSNDEQGDGDVRETRPSDGPFLLRPTDQLTLFCVLLMGAVAISVYTVYLGLGTTGLVAIEQAPRRTFEFQIDINNATWTEIALLPNIGETYARAIVEFRESNGPIEDLETLVQIDGISEKKLYQLRRFTIPLPEDTALVVGKNRP